MTRKTLTRWVLVIAAAGITGFSTAGELRRLPADSTLPQGEGSPGPVRFSHQSHVDADAPRCVTCHPLFFRILERKTASGKPITHEGMEKRGEACGSCHGKDKAAFGFDDCSMCHKT
jgi:c(7)-type cytochrome triheme protein